MHTFTQKLNPITGKSEWVMQPENYDYIQEIARSSYGDMLHDAERNHKYYLAIKNAVLKMKQECKSAKVLDIGTGTGLLSMMAAVAGADSIYACEAFNPVAKCAVNVIKDNGFENKITVINKRSTDLTVGKGCDLPERANILVTEVFDTELIGEGALSTFRHAIKELLDPHSIIVPSSATIYVQVIESSLISGFNKIEPFILSEQSHILPPKDVQTCPGAAAVHDIQLSEISKEDFTALTDVIPIIHFDFTGNVPLYLSNCSTKLTTIKQSGKCEIVFMWWDLQMDKDNDIILSCAPTWYNPKYQWRDHWMQAIYYLQNQLAVNRGDEIEIQAYHDEYSLWFDVVKPRKSKSIVLHPICNCLIHCLNSRTRIGMINDQRRRRKYLDIIKNMVNSSSICLFLGDGNLLPLIAAKIGAQKVFTVESDALQYGIIKNFVEFNQETTKICILNTPIEDISSEMLQNLKVDTLISEPYFSFGLLPWDSFFHFWYNRQHLNKFLNEKIKISPQKAVLKALAVESKDLWKIRAPVIEAEGFNLTAFDKMTQEAISICDHPVEPHALWEYPCKPLSDPVELMTFDINKVMETNSEASGHCNFSSEGLCNCIALWVDFESDGVSITTGPIAPVSPMKKVEWDMYTRQGVYFIQPIESTKDKHLYYTVTFNPVTMNLTFDFKVQSSCDIK